MNIDLVAQYPGIQNDFDLVFADTEFSRLPFPKESIPDWAGKVALLSVGLAALSSSLPITKFYCHRSLNKKILKECDDFVVTDVIPHLDIVESAPKFYNLLQLRRMLTQFLSERRRLTGKVPLICVDWHGDATLLNPLSGTASKFMLLEGVFEIDTSMRTFFKNDFVRHNALHDALAIRKGFMDFLVNGTAHRTG